jgi:hypothetical protein
MSSAVPIITDVRVEKDPLHAQFEVEALKALVYLTSVHNRETRHYHTLNICHTISNYPQVLEQV